MPEFLPDSLAFPGASANDKRSHAFKGADNGSYVRTAATFAPADKPIVGSSFNDYVCNTIAVDQRAHFAVSIRNADGRKLKFDNFHERRSSVDFQLR